MMLVMIAMIFYSDYASAINDDTAAVNIDNTDRSPVNVTLQLRNNFRHIGLYRLCFCRVIFVSQGAILIILALRVICSFG